MKLAVPNLNALAGQGHDALYIGLTAAALKEHNIKALGTE